MILAEQHNIKKSDPRYEELDNLLFLSKNLYNAGLYTIRQHYFNTKKFLNYYSLSSIMAKDNNIDYRMLPSKVSQQTLKILNGNFKSFFSHLSNKNKGNNKDRNVNLPKYLKKDTGRFIVTYTNQSISKKALKTGVIKLTNVNATFQSDKRNIQQVRIVPKNNVITVEVLYKVDDIECLPDNKRYAALDLGLNNLAAVSSNVLKPFIINGKPLKSINQFYNKRLAHLKSKLRGEKRSSALIKSLTNKRNNKVKDYLHKSSTILVNQLVSNNLNTLIIGNNKGWKQDINIGRVNNQNFVQVPHLKFINLLKYKCQLRGINVIITEESYTSKCSFLDNEEIKKHDTYKGRRVKRGLFKSNGDILINADVNGSLNILRKVVGTFEYNPIEVCSTPSVITVKFN